MDEPFAVSEAFDAIVGLALALGAAPLNRYPGAWEHQVDPTWKIAVNAHWEPATVDGLVIPGFHAAIWYNGWPAGLLSPRGGVIAAGEGANEDSFIAALCAATEALQP